MTREEQLKNKRAVALLELEAIRKGERRHKNGYTTLRMKSYDVTCIKALLDNLIQIVDDLLEEERIDG